MIKSIRTRLFLGITALILFFILSSIILNSHYLGKYYIGQKREVLLGNKNLINKIYQGNPTAIAFDLEKLERNSGVNIFIISPEFQLIYGSIFNGYKDGMREGLRVGPKEGPMMGIIRKPMMMERIPFVRTLEEQLSNLTEDEYLFDVVTDPRLSTKFVMLSSRLDNGDFLILITPLAAINESAAIASRFFLFSGIITIALGGIVAFFFARKFTEPIMVLNYIAQRMSKLDFNTKYPVKSEDEIGQLGNSINSLSDQLDKAISELQEANSKLKEDIERERRIDEMRKEFISNVSHELKTPIALIQGYAEGLKLNVHEDEENRNFYCDVIMDEADKMNKQVKDLLNLSQIESGYFKLERSDFPIISLVNHVLEKYRPILEENEIKAEVEYHGEPMVNCDKDRVEQVLVNYLNNAINHVDMAKIIKINITSRNDKVRVAVYNSGTNIPDESLDKLWTSFYKVDKARTRAYGGTGLGLSVVRAIQEQHHNAYGVENNSNGVTFWFELDKVR
jgi:two-component system, OmpR family, sensor histidine kinase VanS